ncbi:BatD family protein [Leucothrix arctica]|uniref:DUF7939 domain-containing protein n=1 Tax=Leucothrix arctica TaxID=1481894 RepID=A0A317C6A9_9GAMM|nr:BatD family protein [Leucothrix arctica]PWQ94138.1 hypothetical protein DKT75_16500 [Leucothrix arctica]
MVVRLGLLITLLCLSLSAYAKGFTAQVDRFSVGMGDHIQLVLSLDDIHGSRPDVSALNKDFTILRTSQSSNMRITNGIVSQEVKWIFLLSPNRKGTLTIPSFTTGGFKSEVINIEVGDAPVAQSTSDEVLLEVEVKPLNPYVKSQAIFTQRLYFAQELVNNASLGHPTLEKGDAEIIFLASSNPSYVKRNGRSYQMIERYYAVFPSSDGELVFAPSVFRGSIADQRQQRGFNMPMFNTGKRVTAYSSKASLNVAEQPKGFTGNNWLPSSQLSLDMTWSQSPETMKAGEPVTATIMVMAQGLKAEALPEITINWPGSIKSYPEKPEFRTDKRVNGLVGLRQEKVVLVANQNGEFQIPAIEVAWWNTATNQQQVERINGFTVKVDGAAAVQLLSPAPLAAEPEPLANKDAEDSALVKEEQSIFDTVSAVYAEHKKHLPVALSVLGLLLLGIGAAYFYFNRPKTQVEINRKILASAQVQLAEACNANNAKAAISALPQWAEAAEIYPATLSGIERCGDPLLSKEVAALSHSRYSQNAQAWNGEKLLVAVKQFSHAPKVDNVSDSLEALHPLH